MATILEIDPPGANIQSQSGKPIFLSIYPITSFSMRICTPADLYVCIVLFSAVAIISAATTGIIFPPTRRLKNPLLEVFGEISTIFFSSPKNVSKSTPSCLIDKSMREAVSAGDIYFSTGYCSLCA
ncbi:MAG: hypothetical protein WCJ81_02285 [bacterium]